LIPAALISLILPHSNLASILRHSSAGANRATRRHQRRVAAATAQTLVVSLSPTVGAVPAAAAPDVPQVSPGAEPVQRPLPASVRGDTAVPPDERPRWCRPP